MLTKISKLNLSYLTKSCRHTLSPYEKILLKIYFLSHFATMPIDSANPENIVGKGKLLKMSNFTFYHNVFYAACLLKSFNSHISVVISNFFEFGTISKGCIREWAYSCPAIERTFKPTAKT